MDTIKDRLYKRATFARLPITGAFELTPICNFDCKMCYVKKSKKEVECMGGLKPLSFWVEAAAQAKECGLIFPLLTGGEVFLYPYIRELCEALRHMGMQFTLNSNASCITEETIRWLVENPPERINITLYGGSNEAYERLCGDPHGFDKVKNGIRLLAENGIRFHFNCSLTPYNCDDLKPMLDFAMSYNQRIRMATYMFPPIRRTGACGPFEHRLTPNQAAYYQVLTDWYQLEPEEFAVTAANAQAFQELTEDMLDEAASGQGRSMGCLAGRCSFWIDWQGNMTSCGMSAVNCVDLQHNSFKDAWMTIVDDTNELRYSPICTNCVNRMVCHTCAAMVYNETGTFQGRPTYLCEMRESAAKYYKEFSEKLPSDLIKSHAIENNIVIELAESCNLEEY